VERAGLPLTFMSGFRRARGQDMGLARCGAHPYGGMLDQGCAIRELVSIPVTGDGDTGYRSGAKRRRARREAGICIVACANARAARSLAGATWRMRAFTDLGADVVYPEAPRSETDVAASCL
jgi:2-methylisocitrate lyase-like PEP mutase family enzyme